MSQQGVATIARGARGGGIWEGMIAALGYRLRRVPAYYWKRAQGVTADKETSLVAARERFPESCEQLTRKKDNGRAEALLIADWMRMEVEK